MLPTQCRFSEPGGSLAGCEVSHSHTNTHRIIKLAHDNTHITVGVRARLLKASEDKFRAVTLTPSSVRFLSAHHLFYNSSCRAKISETNGGMNECIREQDGVFCHGQNRHHVMSYESIFCHVSCHFADVR